MSPDDMPILAVLAGLIAFGLAALGTRSVLAWLEDRQILDQPNARSSHDRPVPRGGGLAVVPAVAVAWAGMTLVTGAAAYGALAVGALLLMGVSWLDDSRGLPPWPRLAAHLVLVTAGLALLGPDLLVFQGWLPWWADRLLAGLGWVWFINLYNFMDGIDGITGVETASLGGGVALVALLAGLGPALPVFAVAPAAAALGFLLWNWHPARIFLGDCGSVPLGYLLGGLLVSLAAQGQLAAALILPAYYLADATVTLAWRLIDREPVWQPHRRHFYQRAVRGGRSHAAVARTVLAGNLALAGCAGLAAAGLPGWGLGGAALVVAALLAVMHAWAKGMAR